MTTSNMLTTLARARSWAGVTTTAEDNTLTTLIGEVSRFILNYLGRVSLFNNSYSEVKDGMGQVSLFLRHWPVTSVQVLTVDDVSIGTAPDTSHSGYVLEPWQVGETGAPQRLSLRGYCFGRGVSNVAIRYNAGYMVVNELQIVPASAPYIITVNAPYGSFGEDEGVGYGNGSALLAVLGSPVAGQYVVSAGVYSFAAADAGKSVFISYSYIPSDIEHACVALVAERYRYRSRIGEISKSLGGQESTSYSQRDMPEFVRTLLQPYRRMAGC